MCVCVCEVCVRCVWGRVGWGWGGVGWVGGGWCEAGCGGVGGVVAGCSRLLYSFFLRALCFLEKGNPL